MGIAEAAQGFEGFGRIRSFRDVLQPLHPDTTPNDSPTDVGGMALSAGNLSVNLHSGIRGGLEPYCLPQQSSVFLFQLALPSAVQKAIKESVTGRCGVVAGAALKQLDGGQYNSSVPGLSHPDAVMVAARATPTQQLLICLPSQP